MVDIPAGWLAIVMAILTAIGAAITGAVTYVFRGKDKQIERLETENAAGRLTINTLQDQRLADLREQRDTERKSAVAAQLMATALADLTAAVNRMVKA